MIKYPMETMKDTWTADVSDIPEHILNKHIEVQVPRGNNRKYLVYEVDFYRKNGYPTRRMKHAKYKPGANLITGHHEVGLSSNPVGSGSLHVVSRDRALNSIKF